MAKTSNGFDAKTEDQTITQISTTARTTIATAGADDSRIMEILIHSDDNLIAHTLTFFMKKGGISVPIKLITIAINQGNITNIPDRVRLLNTDSNFIAGRLLERDQNYYLVLKAGATLEVQLSAATTATKLVTIEVVQRDF